MPKTRRLSVPTDWSSVGYEKGRKSRRLIVNAAGRLFAKNGFTATSVEQIATAASMTKGAVYAHFKRKRDLYLACVADSLSFFREAVEVPTGTPPDRALAMYLEWLGLHLSKSAGARSFMIQIIHEQQDDALKSALILELMADHFARLRQLIAAVNDRVDSAAYAFFAFSILLLDADLHHIYRIMDEVAARTHSMPSTVARLTSMIRTAR